MTEGADKPVEAVESELPAIDFATFVLSLSHSALMQLGDAPDPSGASPQTDARMARQTIQLLGLLQEKTTGNLSGKEERLLDQLLVDLRARYKEVTKSHV